MTNLFRLALIFMLALTSQALAAARGQVMVGGEVVFCAGDVTITMQVDIFGKPVEHRTICPDMALTLMQGLYDVPDLPPLPMHGVPLDNADMHADLHQPVRARWNARDPPLSAQI